MLQGGLFGEGRERSKTLQGVPVVEVFVQEEFRGLLRLEGPFCQYYS